MECGGRRRSMRCLVSFGSVWVPASAGTLDNAAASERSLEPAEAGSHTETQQPGHRSRGTGMLRISAVFVLGSWWRTGNLACPGRSSLLDRQAGLPVLHASHYFNSASCSACTLADFDSMSG